MCNKCYDVTWPDDLGKPAHSINNQAKPQKDRANDEKPVKQQSTAGRPLGIRTVSTRPKVSTKGKKK